MSEGINKVILFGNLGADAELKPTANGSVCKMRLATTEKWKDKNDEKHEKTEWHRIAFFGKGAEKLAPSLKKGARLYIEGRLATSSYEKEGQKHWSTDIIADQIRFGGGPQNGAYQASSSSPPSASLPF